MSSPARITAILIVCLFVLCPVLALRSNGEGEDRNHYAEFYLQMIYTEDERVTGKVQAFKSENTLATDMPVTALISVQGTDEYQNMTQLGRVKCGGSSLFQFDLGHLAHDDYIMQVTFVFDDLTVITRMHSFLVSPVPVLYLADFLDGGRSFFFDPLGANKEPFVIEVYLNQGGATKSLLDTYDDVRESMVIKIPRNRGTLSVEITVMDIYNFTNSQNQVRIDGQTYYPPYEYYYFQTDQQSVLEAVKSTWYVWLVLSAVVMLSFIMTLMYRRSERKAAMVQQQPVPGAGQ
jgi:hypothetical protein